MSNFNFEEVFDNAVTEGFGPPKTSPRQVPRRNRLGQRRRKQGRLPPSWLHVQGGRRQHQPRRRRRERRHHLAQVLAQSEGLAARDAGKLGITGKMLNADMSAAVQTAVGQEWS